MGDINFAASRLDKYPLLAIDTEANSCFSIYQKSGLKKTQKDDYNSTIPAKITIISDANPARVARP